MKAPSRRPQEHINPNQIEGQLAKLQALGATGRYGALLKGIVATNEKSNFLALPLEATFAYQFESVGLPLGYEVKQVTDQTSPIDFSFKASILWLKNKFVCRGTKT